MNKTQIVLVVSAIVSLTLVGVAVYFQLTQYMLPCPLCVIQRYAFILIAISCLLALVRKSIVRKFAYCLGLYASITGAGVALHQLYVIAHPDIRCGIDPVQTAVNSMPFADWAPTLFLAEGMCGTPYDPILGLSIPQWSLTWMVIFTLLLLVLLFKNKKPAS